MNKQRRPRNMPIRPGSRRSLPAAIRKARLHFMSEPNSCERVIEVGDFLLQMLVTGVDCNITGSGAWYSMILNSCLTEDAVHRQETT